MPHQKASFLWRLALLLLLISAPVSAVFVPAADAIPTQSDRMPSLLPVELINDGMIRIDGSSSMFTINQLLQQRYLEQYPDLDVEIEQHGTDAALKALLNDEIDLAAIGRSLTLEEKAKGLVEVPVSQEKIAIIIGRENSFQGSLTLDQLVKIFRGEITNWSEVGGADVPIRIIDRPEASDTRLALSQYGLLEEIRRFPFKGADVVHLETDDTAEVIQALGDDGISYAILDQVRDQNTVRLVRIAILQDVLPDSNLYPYAFSRGYAYKATIDPDIQSFVGFATTKPGQEAVVAAKSNEAKAVLSTLAAAVAAKQAPTIAPSVNVPPVNVPAIEIPSVEPSIAIVEKTTVEKTTPASAPEPVDSESPIASVFETAKTKATTAIETAQTQANAMPKVITPVPSGRVVTQPELNQQYFDNSAEITPPVVVEKPARVIEKSADTENSPIVVEKPTRVVERLDKPQTNEPSFDELQAPAKPPVAMAEPQPTIDATENIQEITETEKTESDRKFPVWFWWLLLPLLLIGSAFRWLNNRRTKINTKTSTKTSPPQQTPSQTTVAAKPVAPEPVAPEPIAETTEPVIEPAAELPTPVEAPMESLAVEAETGETVEPITSEPIVTEVMTPVPRDDSEPTVETFKETFLGYLQGYLGKTPETATQQECYAALSYVIRDRIFQRNRPEAYLQQPGMRLVGEIAAEYVPGPHLANNLVNLGYLEQVRQAMRQVGLNLDDLFEQEEEPGLGTGGLGRLMVCYLDSLSTAEVPAIGYGIRYEFGIFDQEIRDGWQVEIPDSWLRNGNPWELEAPEAAVEVKFGGQTQAFLDDRGQYRVRWVPAEIITGTPYDTPILGYRTNTVNLLRLWKAENSDRLCKVLYPVDMEIQGKALRLKQQFFLVSCALQDALRLHKLYAGSPDTLHERIALQINDTDPTLSVAELMRLLIDEYGIEWDKAWAVTQQTLSYTNHSLMPETLDDLWSIGVFSHFLPRHLEIIFEINNRFLEQVRTKYPDDVDRIQRMSLIDERGDRYVRTTYLACVGSHAINGVSKLHTQLLEQTILRDFHEMYPEKFSNKTNGFTPRRFLLLMNPRLANLITSEIGDGWITNLSELKKLEGFVGDRQFCQEWRQIKQACKQDLATYIQQQTGVEVDVNSLFDMHTMRLHEYMRKHLQVLHILTLYNQVKANPDLDITPRTFIFSGKAAPDYFTAKLIIKLIHSVATLINSDLDVRGRLKVVFLPDYNLKIAQRIYPAADVAEYISTAGTEACSTGNMIFALNGATIIGTLDGSNIELRETVGVENFFSFGLAAEEAVDLRANGYTPMDSYNANPDLKAAIDLIASGALSDGDTEMFQPLVNLLLHSDYYLLLADYQSFLECQAQVSQTYRNSDQWTQMSILNAARIGTFSSDRAIAEYCQDIWNIKPVGDRLRQFTQPQAG